MSIEAKIICDSISPEGVRLTTFQLRYPRFIHAELMTHRVFSRNASSSRAIPVKKMIEDLRRDPAMPVFWGSNKPGMQAGDEIDDIENAQRVWLAGRDQAIIIAESLIEGFGLHKQIANRILEPWAHINVVVTATDWQNFFTLRCHKDAQPELKALADMMWLQMENSPPTPLQHGEWHLPYIVYDDREAIRDRLHKGHHPDEVSHLDQVIDLLQKISVARCARVSYLTHEGKPTSIDEDIKLFERLVGAQPLHASPAEHQATPDIAQIVLESYDPTEVGRIDGWENPHLHGNFRGWKQLRKMLPGEFVPD